MTEHFRSCVDELACSPLLDLFVLRSSFSVNLVDDSWESTSLSLIEMPVPVLIR